jgi:hypothetical protein
MALTILVPNVSQAITSEGPSEPFDSNTHSTVCNAFDSELAGMPSFESIPSWNFGPDRKKSIFKLDPEFRSQVLLGAKMKMASPSITVNFEPLITQFIRHAELESNSAKILPWVYATTTESIVIEFETAVRLIDHAEDELNLAMYDSLYGQSSISKQDHLGSAAAKLDEAEVTLFLLIEFAKIEL